MLCTCREVNSTVLNLFAFHKLDFFSLYRVGKSDGLSYPEALTCTTRWLLSFHTIQTPSRKRKGELLTSQKSSPSTPLLTSRRNTSSPWKLQTENTFSRQQTHRLRKYGWQSCWSCVEKVRSCLCFEDGHFDDSVVYPTLNSSAFTHNYPPATQVWKSTLASFPCRPSTRSFLLAAQVWHMHTSTCKWNRTWA